MTQPPPWIQPPAPPVRRRRGGRTALLGCGGLIGLAVLIMIIAGVAGSHGSSSSSGSGVAPAASFTPLPTPPAPTASATPTLSAADQRFVTGLASALAAKGEESTGTPAETAAAGASVCQALRAGSTPAQILSDVQGSHSSGKLIIRTAEKYLCPSFLPRVLLTFSGSGIENSAPFLVNSGTVTVKYTYDCSGAGGSGNFIADLKTGDQGSLSSDDQSIANALGAGGSTTTTVYPQNVGSEYHVAVNSECDWSLVVTSG